MKKKTVEAKALPADSLDAPALHCTSDHLKPWIPIISTNVSFPLEIFYQVCEALVLHPEWSSSSIIRCDVLRDLENAEDAPHFKGYEMTRTIYRCILPRKPSDGTLEQGCHFYESLEGDEGMLVMIPKISSRDASSVPFYHPQVAGIAFRHRLCISAQIGNLTSDTTPDESAQYSLQMDYLPLEAPQLANIEAGQPYWAEDSRTYRTALQLLTLLAKHGKSQTSSSHYVKRVHHDRIVPREGFQDLYVKLKEKYLWILDEWKEVTDPLKHVFEDVAIASFLICLWRSMYKDTGGHPPGGFVDVGCGNGLLVFLLHREGYSGYGLDLRARKSWALWGEDTPLRTTTLSPPELCLSDTTSPFPTGSFLIGNHADELTPWLPLLASLTPHSGFFNMPCCMHTFVDRFTHQEHTIENSLFTLPNIEEDMKIYEGMTSEKGGRYAAYLNYIAELTIRAGWRPEREALRVPSTKYWAFVGRKRIWAGLDKEEEEEEKIKEWSRRIASESLSNWKPREPEGKDH